MAYPDHIDRFTKKLNKKQDDTVYVIEERLVLKDGVYEGVLAHDHIRRESIRIYTGPELSGDEVIQYYLSVPAETPWKLTIKIFSAATAVYVTYETPGDRVEAEDVNHLQDSMVSVQSELDRFKSVADDVSEAHFEQLEQLAADKADQISVNAALLDKADKANTYTREQTDERIQRVIGAAPEALDTLQELAQALDNDPDFAATMTTQLAGKVDKAAGKQLSTEDYSSAEKAKLAGIAAGANLYVHPATHSADMIAETASLKMMTTDERTKLAGIAPGANQYVHPPAHPASIITESEQRQFVSADERAKLESIEPGANAYVHPVTHPADVITETAGLKVMTAAERTKLAGIAAGANQYVHPATHPPSIIAQDPSNRLVTDTEKATWHAKETPAGAQAKVDTHADDQVKHVTASDRATWDAKETSAGAQAKVNTHAEDGVRHITAAERTAWNAKQVPLGFTPENTSRRGVAGGYAELDANGRIPDNRISATFVTQSQLGGAGYGDMTKSVYDTNNNGKVDAAEAADSVPWSGITGRPSTFAPSAHTHNVLSVQSDNARDGTALPSVYERGVTTFFSNNPTNKFNGVSYCTVMTIKGHSNMAAVQYIYPYNVDAPISYRYALFNTDAWREWRTLAVASEVMPRGPLTWNQVKGV